MLGRSFNRVGLEHEPFGKDLRKMIVDSSFTLINLETTITTRGKKDPESVFHFRMKPSQLHWLEGVTHVNLANNHALDFGSVGLKDTLTHLTDHNIEHSGASHEEIESDATEMKIHDVEGVKIGVVSAADHFERWKATKKNKTGIHHFRLAAEEERSALVQLCKESKRKCDLLIFSVHWGYNWQTIGRPEAEIRSLAKKLVVEGGVDIIHGHSAHHVQPFEIIGNSVVYYSLGAMVDDYATKEKWKSDVGMLALVDYCPKSKKIKEATGRAIRVDARRLYAELSPIEEDEEFIRYVQKLLK